MWYLIPLFLCWGSFLNVIAYRLIHDLSFKESRSICPSCHHAINWYDLLPIISWIMLKRRCRHCQQPISLLYPLIELLTAISLFGMTHYIIPTYWPIYFIFISALIITIRTDLETMQISRLVTLCLIPLPIIASLTFYSSYPLIPLRLSSVLLGASFGYFVLWLINKLFFWYAKQDGMGQGDLDLLATIGAFTGLTGAWFSLVIGSISGATAGLILIGLRRSPTNHLLPFGPFLALGALIFIFFQDKLLNLFF